MKTGDLADAQTIGARPIQPIFKASLSVIRVHTKLWYSSTRESEGLQHTMLIGLARLAAWAGIVGIAVYTGAALIAAAAIKLMGFAKTGIVAGSIAAKMMSAWAVANGGGVSSSSLVALLQRIGVLGLFSPHAASMVVVTVFSIAVARVCIAMFLG